MTEITNYMQAFAYLKGGRNPDDRPLPGNGTRLQRRGYDLAVNYRGTDVVTYHENGTYSLDRGGWNTDTTQRRIEQYSPFKVVSGALETTWARDAPFSTREFVRRGPDDWIMQHPDGQTFKIQDGLPIRPER